MNLLLNFYNLIQISNFSLLSFSCWLRGKSSLPLLNDKVKLVNSCVKIYDYLKLWITSKVVGSMQFFLPKYLWNNWHAVALIGMRIKLPKNIVFVLFECIYFIKEPIQMKGFLTMVYIKEYYSKSEDIIKYSKFRMDFFCGKKINKLMHDRVLCLQSIIIIQ